MKNDSGDCVDFCWIKCFEKKASQPDFGLPTYADCAMTWGEIIQEIPTLKECPYLFERGVAAGMKDA